MGNKKAKDKHGEIRIITDKPKNSEYIFVNDRLTKESNLRNDVPRESTNKQNAYSLRTHSVKFKNTDY
jgi:hypothetical protein